jgi:hypothetical protein
MWTVKHVMAKSNIEVIFYSNNVNSKETDLNISILKKFFMFYVLQMPNFNCTFLYNRLSGTTGEKEKCFRA